jgi:hypothetical protein
MKKAFVFSFFLLLGLIYFSFYDLMPSKGAPLSTSESEFSSERALIPLKEISKAPHYIGSEENRRVRAFLIQSLEDLGLEPETQQGYVFNQRRAQMTQPVNILAKIKGTDSTKSLLIFSHYDSALTPSFGASDAGSGVVTILESLRAYQASGKQPKNDIIILFTDGEEVGLEGAKLFVRSHPWAKNVGLSLNFESRGSGGPSSMILETNQGNKNLIQSFMAANLEFPVASSLLYSIYKMLPNDTDSTILRKEGDIEGLFFAFIDDHFDYHTAGDSFERLDRNTLQHQGSYLLPLLHYFSNVDLEHLKSEEDYVYTNFPFIKMIAYPFDWIMPMTLLACLLFIGLLFFGFKKGILNLKLILKGFVPYVLSLIFALLLGLYGWKLILKLYPHYQEIQHGFTYNGHAYIVLFVALTLAAVFYLFQKFSLGVNIVNQFVAPLFFWLIINILLAFYLKGAAYFILPFYCALLSFGLLLRDERTGPFLLLILGSPAVFLFSPLIQTFPIGLGLKMIVVSTLFTVLLFGLLFSFMGSYDFKKSLTGGFLLLTFILFFHTHLTSEFNEDRKKPNSLIYSQDLSSEAASWLTYDSFLDDWTRSYLGESPVPVSLESEKAGYSKYNSGYTYTSKAQFVIIPHYKAQFTQDTLIGDQRRTSFRLIPEKKAHVLKLYADSEVSFDQLSFNGVEVSKSSSNELLFTQSNNRLLTFYVSEKDTLEISYVLSKEQHPTFTLFEYSFDLMNNPWLEMKERPKHMMPKPFVYNDALLIRQKIIPPLDL